MQVPGLKRIALFIAILAGFITPFDLSAVIVALPSIGAEFSMDAITLSWISTAYLLAAGVFLVPFGRIADIYGRKKVFIAGLSLFLLSSFLMVFSTSSLMVILFRILQGSGGALIFGTSVAILTEVTPVTERGRALGIYTTAVYLGLSLGPFIGGFLITRFGWRSIFLINIPLGFVAIAMILLFLKGEWADSQGERFDTGGAIQYGLTLVCVMYGFSLLPDREGFILILAGLVMLGVFILRELRISYPLLDMDLFRRNRVFAFSNLAALINYAATFSVIFFLSLYLQYIRGFPGELCRNHPCHPAGHAGTFLSMGRAPFRPDRTDQNCVCRNGSHYDRAVPVNTDRTGYAGVPARCYPCSARLWVCPLLFAQRKCDHEFGREKVSRRCVRNARHHAARWPDALDGYCDNDHCTLCREGTDHPSPVRPASDGNEDRVCGVCRHEYYRDLLLAEKRQPERNREKRRSAVIRHCRSFPAHFHH